MSRPCLCWNWLPGSLVILAALALTLTAAAQEQPTKEPAPETPGEAAETPAESPPKLVLPR